MRIALVHDDLVQWGGAERVLLGLCEMYPDAPVYTSLYDGDNKLLSKQFKSKKIITSFLQKIPGWKKLYKSLLPFYPLAFEQFDFSKFDLVISNTTRLAKSIITKPGTIHICYCHTPPRFLWHFSGKRNYGLGQLLLSNLRIYDKVTSRRADYFIAGSKNARERIKKIYGLHSRVVYPFIDLERFQNIESFDGGYFVVLSRLNKYKNIDIIVKACLRLGLSLKLIGSGPELDNLVKIRDVWGLRGGGRVEFLGNLDDRTTINVLAGCKALVIAGIEDFGLTSLEAQALGKPVVAFGKGGVLETVIPGKTGILFASQTEDSLTKALNELDSYQIDPQDCVKNATQFSRESFIKNFRATVASLL